MSEVRLNPPKQRTCTRCGREDVWEEEVSDWTIKEVDGTKQSGDRFCMHEWDITGSHAPIKER
jgi:hypothetical protein